MNFVQPLLDLQEIDARIRECEQEMKDIPARKLQETASIREAEAELKTAKAALLEAQNRVNASEAEIKAMQERIAQMKEHQGTLKANAEFTAFSLEIQRLENDTAKQESRQIIALDDLIPLKQRVGECEARLAAETASVEGYLKELDERLADVEKELQKAQAERTAFAAGVPPALLMPYERVKTRRWPAVVAISPDKACTGCHLVQPPSVEQAAKKNNQNPATGKPVTCMVCGRLLYAEE